MTRANLFYHGGPAGIVEFILPASETGVASCSSYGAAGIHRRDRVYITTDPHVALLWACGSSTHGKGCVYVVEPIGSVDIDPDYIGPAAVSFQCEKARIVGYRPVKGKMMKRVRRQILGVA